MVFFLTLPTFYLNKYIKIMCMYGSSFLSVHNILHHFTLERCNEKIACSDKKLRYADDDFQIHGEQFL